jgi:heterodisulfide reductase subunit B2
MKMSYYPGCSLTGTSAEYDRSIREVARLMDIELVELEDWNCCGASSGHMTDHRLAIGLSARNIDIASKHELDLMVPCSACFQRLKVADQAVRSEPEKWGRDSPLPAFSILHLTRFLSQPGNLEKLRSGLSRPLTELKLACYYGCLSIRPPAVTGAPDYEDPQGLDLVVRALGAEGVRWSHKTECCSSSLSMTRPDIAQTLIGDITGAARRGGAQAIVTDCPMCQANLESRQTDSGEGKMPVFFITELVAYALARDDRPRRWRQHLVDPEPLLRQLGL